MSRWEELQRTKVKPGDPAPRDPRARKVVEIRRGPRSHRTFEAVLECGHTLRRRMLIEPTSLICTSCARCGGIGNRLGGQ